MIVFVNKFEELVQSQINEWINKAATFAGAELLIICIK